MNSETTLQSALPGKGITIISGYSDKRIHAYVAGYRYQEGGGYSLFFPKGHSFSLGQKITMHLDNRTGVDEYDADLRVYRTSYKGTVSSINGNDINVVPDEYMLFYSDRCVGEFKSPAFAYDSVPAGISKLPPSEISPDSLDWNEKENGNKLGVLITSMTTRPHTSLMAFLSNKEDDVFLITLKGTFKSKVLHSDSRCCFAIDHRSEYNFERALDWNYTIIEADAYEIEERNPVFNYVKHHFIEKNPWETSFFLSPEIEMFHLKQRRLMLPGCMGD